MKESSIPSRLVAAGVETAWEAVSASFERFCLTAGIATLTEMMQQDAVELCGARHARSSDRRGYRWGHTAGKLGDTPPTRRTPRCQHHRQAGDRSASAR